MFLACADVGLSWRLLAIGGHAPGINRGDWAGEADVFGLTVISGNNLVFLAEPTTRMTMPESLGEQGGIAYRKQVTDLGTARSEAARLD